MNVVTYGALGDFFLERGLAKLAIKCINKLIESDSLTVPYLYNLRGNSYYFIGEFDKAEADYRKRLENDPDHFYTLSGLSLLLIAEKRYEEAEKMLVKIEKSYPDQKSTWIKATFYASQGQKEKALNVHEEKTTDVYALLGMKDEAIRLCAEWSELQRKLKKSLFYELKTTPFYDNIRSDPRFQEILAKDKELYEENLRKYGDIDI